MRGTGRITLGCVCVSELKILMWISVMETSGTNLKVKLIHCISRGASVVREGYRVFGQIGLDADFYFLNRIPIHVYVWK